MLLSQLLPQLNKHLREQILHIASADELVYPSRAASLLGYTNRRWVDNLCESFELEFVSSPTRRIDRNSIINYLLKKHGYNNITIDASSLTSS